MMNRNKYVFGAYVVSFAYNICTDDSNDKFSRKAVRAALKAIPVSLTLETTGLVDKIAEHFDVEPVEQPLTSEQSFVDTMSSFVDAAHKDTDRVVAYHSPKENTI